MKSLSIIIVTYNSQDIIVKCLEHLFLHNDIHEELEVIIVDNSSIEVSTKMFEMLNEKFPGKLTLIKNDKNGGYGQGNNLGITYANGKLLAIMNPDIIMTEPLFKNAINQFKNDWKLAILGYKQYGGFNLSYYTRQEFSLPILTPFFIKFFNKINLFSSKYMYLSGAFLFLPKEEFKRIGLFDENIFLYCEESDITKRALNKGLKIKFDKSKSYIHEIDERTEMSEPGFGFLLDSTMYYLDKFSFNKKLFLNKYIFELKIKKGFYKLVNKKEISIILDNQIKQIKERRNSI